jgi:hypothetical protein
VKWPTTGERIMTGLWLFAVIIGALTLFVAIGAALS